MRSLALLLLAPCLALAQAPAAPPAAPKPQWALATSTVHVAPGGPVEVLVVSLAGDPLEDELQASLKHGAGEQVVALAAAAPAEGDKRRYRFTMPAGVAGSATLELVAGSSSVLVLLVDAPPGAAPKAAEKGNLELPLSENDPMYFIVGGHRGGDMTAKFQLSFKYRLFDTNAGFGKEQPWLTGFYFGYTQMSIWDLSEDSKPFRDTNYKPSVFWQWERTDDRTWIDAARVGFEHESNGRGGFDSRSINTVFFRPEWHWKYASGSRLEFTPKAYAYVDKSDNPDINHYRGYVDWRVRYDTGANWIGTGVVRYSDTGRGSVLFDLSRRIRDLKFGPIGGYLHFQVFSGYGEELLDYNVKRDTQFRIGFSIVP